MQNEPIKISSDKKPKIKKITILFMLAIVAFAIITTITVFLLKKSGFILPVEREVVVTIDSANALKQNGIEALKNDDDEMAKDAFEQAKEQYEELGDTNNVVDMEAQLYLLNN